MEIPGKLPYGIVASELNQEQAELIQNVITTAFLPGVPVEEFLESPRMHLSLTKRVGRSPDIIEKVLEEVERADLEAVIIYNPESSQTLVACCTTIARRNSNVAVLYCDMYSEDKVRPDNELSNVRFVGGSDIIKLAGNLVMKLAELETEKYKAKVTAMEQQKPPPYGTPAD